LRVVAGSYRPDGLGLHVASYGHTSGRSGCMADSIPADH
jgi:hypothetical protein